MDRDPELDKVWRVIEASGASAIDNTALDLKVASLLQGNRYSQPHLFTRLQSSLWTKLEDFWGVAKLFLLVLQPPRSNHADGVSNYTKPDDIVSKTCKLHTLCTSCQRVFRNSGLISGSRFWLTRTVETHTLHTALYNLDLSVKAGCHFCTLVWQTLDDGEGSLDWVLSAHRLRDVNPRLSELWQNILNGEDASPSPESPATKPVKLCISRFPFDESPRIDVLYEYIIEDADSGSEEGSNDAKLLESQFGRTLFTQISRNEYGSTNAKSHAAVEYLNTSSTEHVKLSKYWLNECVSKHLYCNADWTGFVPSRLIQICSSVESTTVRLHVTGAADQGIRYCTLSYCWGKVRDVLTLTSRNIDAFRNDIPLDGLPHTLQDAISITKGLGCTYLWIDSLCIIQDLQDDWARESAVMGSIYQNSLCTITAAAADNADGGCFSARNPLSYDWCKLSGEGKDALYASLAYRSTGARNEVLRESPLIERAWVMQERLLSPRMLHFGPRGIYWTCLLGSASEHDVEGTGAPSTGELVPDTQQLFGPSVEQIDWRPHIQLVEGRHDFESLLTGQSGSFKIESLQDFHRTWAKLVWQYTRCKLTKPNDKLVALSGLAQRIKEETGFRYHAGLWEQTILYDLCWFRSRRPEPRPPEYRAPSWSWASAEGVINDYLQLDYREETSFMADFSAVEVETQPSDTSKTGQVLTASLEIIGSPRKLICPLRAFSYMTLFEGSCELYDNDKYLGLFHPDFPLTDHCSQELILLPLLKLTVPDSTFLSLNRETDKNPFKQTICGLVLTLSTISDDGSEPCYERVGFFGIRCQAPDFSAMRWFDGVAKKAVIIR